jgi:hypothetical protein
MRQFKDPPSGGFDFEWLVFRDQLFNQRCVHWIRMFLNSSMLIHTETVKTSVLMRSELECGDLAPLWIRNYQLSPSDFASRSPRPLLPNP